MSETHDWLTDTRQLTTEPTRMPAIVQDHYAEAEDVLRLEAIEQPAIGDGEVLPRVHAAGVDRGVWHLMTGPPYPVRLAGYAVGAPKTRVPGREIAGRVEAIGNAVMTLQQQIPFETPSAHHTGGQCGEEMCSLSLERACPRVARSWLR